LTFLGVSLLVVFKRRSSGLVVWDISILVYDVFPWLVLASWFWYALEKWVVRIFFCL